MFTRFSALILASSLVFTGCAAQSNPDNDEDPSTLQSDDALSSFGALLVGTYKTDAAYPKFDLNKDDSYRWDSGIRCITTPCPSGDVGRWAVYVSVFTGVRYVNLRSDDGRVSRWFRVASTSKLVGAFGTTGTFTKWVKGACTTNAECAGGEQCDAGACVARALCVQVDGTDGRVVAKNFAAGQYAEANAWGETTAAGSSWGISLANCATVAADMACTEEYAPVCALTVSMAAAKTFGNRCDLRRSVIAEAGDFGESLAISTKGACVAGAARCSTFWMKSDPTSAAGAYYVKSFKSDFEAKAWPQLHPSAIDAQVLSGACHDLTICTKEYNPVCGGVRSDDASTFGNRCMFQAAVRASSATEGWSKGYIRSAGECTP